MTVKSMLLTRHKTKKKLQLIESTSFIARNIVKHVQIECSIKLKSTHRYGDAKRNQTNLLFTTLNALKIIVVPGISTNPFKSRKLKHLKFELRSGFIAPGKRISDTARLNEV